MSAFEIYTFVLCLIVFCMLGGISTAMLIHMYKLTARLIDVGAEDEAILIEYQKKTAAAKRKRFGEMVDKVTSFLLLALLLIAFLFSFYLQLTESKRPNGIPSLKVVKSGSMATIYKDNKTLTALGIDNQIQVFDLILTHHLPEEKDLKLYDIVLYTASNGKDVIHRIVGIEAPNEKHPDCYYFVLQGDANKYADEIPVYYSQMKGIYKNERIPFVGSFILFMQSPAGWMCIILVAVASIASPIMTKKLQKKIDARLALMGIPPAPEPEPEPEPEPAPAEEDLSILLVAEALAEEAPLEEEIEEDFEEELEEEFEEEFEEELEEELEEDGQAPQKKKRRRRKRKNRSPRRARPRFALWRRG